MRKDLYKDLYTTEDSHWWHIAKRNFVEQLINTYTQKKGISILDVGCGTGKNLEFLAHHGEVWGVDISEEALLFCKKRGLLQVKKGEAEKLPFESETFDVVCALDVLEHVDALKSICEIKRVLKNNGSLIITVPAFSWLWSKWDEVLHHNHRYTKEEIHTILQKEGFVIRKNTYIHLFLVLPILIIRKLKQIQNKTYTSDFQINNVFVNKIFLTISKLEQMWINRYDMPFGTSVLCIAQKRSEK
ncbi:MAG: class I SAM-dependent methyltransferase [Candidatus Roizmanbacteria bacterium]|nr:class I SAM-dependent methyltransferase [Candidatus Roizmanbacteria bacterium]